MANIFQNKSKPAVDKADKYIGALLGGCCGDVLGSQTEGMTRAQIISKFGDQVSLMPEKKLYTDDTEMTLVLARHLVKNNEVKLVELHEEYAKEITDKGYSKKTRNTLALFKEGRGAFCPAGNSDHNGSVMRIAPLGLMKFETRDLIRHTREAIYYTHGNSADSHASAFLHCKLIRALLEDRFETKKEYFIYIMGHARNHSPLWVKMNLVHYCLKVSPPVPSITAELLGHEDIFQIKAIDALCCAMYIFFRFYEDPKKAVCFAASMGGDTDTIAKITGDLCGALHGTGWIPEEWRGVEGEEELTALGKKLCEMAGSDVL